MAGAGVGPDESMNSRVSWNVEGIDPSVRERAESAARRAGMSLSDWLNSTIGESAPPDFARASEPAADAGPGVARRCRHSPAARFHYPPDRTDLARGAARQDSPRSEPARGEPGIARQLNDAISRLDARLSQISNPAAAKTAFAQNPQHQADLVERAAAEVYRPSPPLSPGSLELAVAEITARQSELDNAAPRPGAAAQCAATGADHVDAGSAGRARFRLARASSVQDHQPDRSAAAARRGRAVDRRLPGRTGRDSRRHHRGDAAPGDRIDRKRDPVAVPPHRRHQAKRHR